MEGQYSKGIIFLITAPSGCGKDTLINEVKGDLGGLVSSVKATTRYRRESEVHGRDYIYMSKDEFLSQKEAGRFVQVSERQGNPVEYFGLRRSELEETVDNGYDLIITSHSFGSMDETRKKLLECGYGRTVPVLIYASPDVILKRLKGRAQDPESKIAERMKADIENLKNILLDYSDAYMYQILNEGTISEGKEKLIAAILDARAKIQ